MDRSIMEQEREIRDMLRRSKSTPDRHGNLRRETFRCLIDLAHSEQTPLKIISAGHIRFFLTDFPDLEEAAIDAIYDLCEDPSSKVRIEGYRAVTQVSKVQSKWIKRNADVLVQLLQSEEADEVVVVKKALTEHLDMDPKITLGVLCDQISPPDDAMDEEDVHIRERLRSLVLAFMAGEAKRAICERHAVPGASGESVLYEGLFSAIPKLGMDDLNLITKDLVYALPAFKSKQPNERGSELLQLLLAEKVTPALKADLHSVPSTGAALAITRPILEICEHITCVLQAAPALDLLQFYCVSLIGKITLQKMMFSEQLWIVCSLARLLSVAEKQDRSTRLPSLRRTIVDACPYLLEVLRKSNLSEPGPVAAYGVFLRACSQRTKESSWAVPTHLLAMLQELHRLPEIARNEEYGKLIRSLTPPSQPRPISQGTSSLQYTTVPSTPKLSIPSNLPSRPLTLPNINLHPNMPRSVPTQNASTAQDTLKRETMFDSSSTRPVKRPKVEETPITQKGPSLLSRLGTSISRQSSRSDLSSRTESVSPKPEDVPSSQAGHGLSIKGAAAKQAKQNGSSNPRVATSSSLLERLQDPYPGGSSNQHSQSDIGRKRRNF